MSTTKPSRSQQKNQTRQAFFQATLDACMTGQSFSAISLRQITRTVGVVPTAFYRHFTDMDHLGTCLVQETLGNILANLREHLQLGKTRTHQQQIATIVERFFESINQAPKAWHFLVTERYGGNQAVHNALDEQLRIFNQSVSLDLSMQPNFQHFDDHIRLLIADVGVNLFFSWVYDWLKINQLVFKNDINHPDMVCQDQTLAYIQQCTHQAQIVFYGVSNWQSEMIV